MTNAEHYYSPKPAREHMLNAPRHPAHEAEHVTPTPRFVERYGELIAALLGAAVVGFALGAFTALGAVAGGAL